MNCSSSSCLKQFLKCRAFFPLGKKKINSAAWAHIWYLCRTNSAKQTGRWILFPCAYHQQNILVNCSWSLIVGFEQLSKRQHGHINVPGGSYVLPNLYYCSWCLRGKEFSLTVRCKSEFVGWTVKKKEVCSAVSWAHLLMCTWHLDVLMPLHIFLPRVSL